MKNGNQLEYARFDPPPRLESGGADPSLSSYERLISDLLKRMRIACQTDTATQSQQQRNKLGLTEVRGLLWKLNKLYVPRANVSLVQDILYWHHDVPWCAHLGIKKTVDMVKRQFWWPGMDLDITEYVKSCVQCQVNKPDRQPTKPPLTPLSPPDVAWKQMGVDLVVDLPVTQEGYNAICVFVCHLTKMVRLVATQTTLSATGFASLFMKEVFPHYGLPENLISDRGPQWNSEMFQAMCDTLGIKLKLSTAYHPQTNGLVERTNEVVGTALRHYVASDHRDWNEYLPFIEFALNSSYHETIQCTPFQLNRIVVPKNPFGVLSGVEGLTTSLGHNMGVSTINSELGVRTALQAHEKFEWAKKCVQVAKDRMKMAFDGKKRNQHLYQMGDKVWFNIRNISLRHPTMRHKLVPKYLGPVVILETVGRSAVKLELPAALKIHPTVSISLVKPFHSRKGCSPPPVQIAGIEEWEVDKVTDHNLLRSKKAGGLNLVEFKAKWKGSYEDSWHELVDFKHSIELVEQYLRVSCTKSVRDNILKVLTQAERQMLSGDLFADGPGRHGAIAQ